VGSGQDFTIYKDEGSTEEEDIKESNEAKVKITDSVRTGSSDFFLSSPNEDHKGGIIGGGGMIDPQSLCSDGNDYAQYKACIGRDGLSLNPHDCMCFVYSSREGGDTILVVHFKSVVSSWEREDNWILKIIDKIQGADLRRFNKHKKRATLGMDEYPPAMNCPFFAVLNALKYGCVSIPYHLMLYTNGVAE
jgi:hypothetical protein